MTQVRIIVEYIRSEEQHPFARWEHRTDVQGNPTAEHATEPGASKDTCELLGRAFELILREEEKDFSRGLEAFFRGAMLQNEDILQVLSRSKYE